jgi:hypothetical protein
VHGVAVCTLLLCLARLPRPSRRTPLTHSRVRAYALPPDTQTHTHTHTHARARAHRVVGVHKLLLLNLYPFLQKYIAPHQRDVTAVLAALVQGCHELVPPETLAPVMRQLVDQFVHDRRAARVEAPASLVCVCVCVCVFQHQARIDVMPAAAHYAVRANTHTHTHTHTRLAPPTPHIHTHPPTHRRARPEVMTVGLKSVRELCLRCPLVMTPELLHVRQGCVRRGGAGGGRTRVCACARREGQHTMQALGGRVGGGAGVPCKRVPAAHPARLCASTVPLLDAHHHTCPTHTHTHTHPRARARARAPTLAPHRTCPSTSASVTRRSPRQRAR